MNNGTLQVPGYPNSGEYLWHARCTIRKHRGIPGMWLEWHAGTLATEVKCNNVLCPVHVLNSLLLKRGFNWFLQERGVRQNSDR